MDPNKIVAIILIALGSLIMALSIVKYYSTIRLAEGFLDSKEKNATRWYKTHHLLMVFFLFGYIIVLGAVYNDIKIVSDFFTSIIFFFGAAFVLIGILLQSRMLKSIKQQHMRLEEKNDHLRQLEDATIYALSYLAEIRDFETGKHIERTSQYVRVLTETLR